MTMLLGKKTYQILSCKGAVFETLFLPLHFSTSRQEDHSELHGSKRFKIPCQSELLRKPASTWSKNE